MVFYLLYCGMECSVAGECWCWPSPHFIFTACDSSGQPVGGAQGSGGGHIQEDNENREQRHSSGH